MPSFRDCLKGLFWFRLLQKVSDDLPVSSDWRFEGSLQMIPGDDRLVVFVDNVHSLHMEVRCRVCIKELFGLLSFGGVSSYPSEGSPRNWTLNLRWLYFVIRRVFLYEKLRIG